MKMGLIGGDERERERERERDGDELGILGIWLSRVRFNLVF